MATETIVPLPIQPTPTPAADPYFHGWRMVPRWDEAGRQSWEQVPLTEWDVLHPEEEDFIVSRARLTIATLPSKNSRISKQS
jgi:hypothetical protein